MEEVSKYVYEAGKFIIPEKIAITLSIVEIQFKRVVFPLPLAPIIATNSPLLTSNDKLSIAFVDVYKRQGLLRPVSFYALFK